jgi:hypothetical protein
MVGTGHQSHRSRWGHPHLFQDIDLFFAKNVANKAAGLAYTVFNEDALGGRKPLANEFCIFAEAVLAELVGMLLSEYFRNLPVLKGRLLFSHKNTLVPNCTVSPRTSLLFADRARAYQTGPPP